MFQMVLVHFCLGIDVIEVILMVLNYKLELLPWVLIHLNKRNIWFKWLKCIPVAVEGVEEDSLGVVFHIMAEAKHEFILLIFCFILLVLNHLAP